MRKTAKHHGLVTIALLTLATIAARAHAECDQVADDSNVEPQDLAGKLGVSTYDPIYFILGGDGGFNAKFQISFKYQIFREQGWFSRCLRMPSHIYLSFTQTSLWDLEERSSPFKDSSYRPRLFYSRADNWVSDNKKWQLGLEAGFAHESNGKADPDSRSINTAYVRPTLSYRINQKHKFYVAPMVNSYIDVNENPDIRNYRGHVDLLLGYGNGNDGDHDWNFWTILRKGDEGDYGSIEANLAIPFKFLTGGRLNGWLLTQYFAGWGESLVDYNRKFDSQLRAGFAILVQ